MINYIDSKISTSTDHPFLKLGILIIGSLFWDARHNRGQWRNSRLDLEKKFFVRVPIRYGRKSGKRANTYTMVFSPSCEKGQAIAVECKSPVSSVQDILAETFHLWEAEGGENGSIAGNWGAVGLLVNPASNINQKIIDGWAEFVSKEKDYAKFEFQPKEGPVINNEGILQLDWPRLVSGEELPFDIVLATATAPTLDRASLDYPSVQTIATAWNEHREEQYYFRSNRQNRITTFEDEAIEQLLQK